MALYAAIMLLNGNDILPTTGLEMSWSILGLLMGSFMNAYIFGNLVVLVQSMNRKMQLFQEKLDITNTTMKNMKLSTEIQLEVRQFLMKTQSGLDHQTELTEFLAFIAPSLRLQVIQFIFQNTVKNNEILAKTLDNRYIIEQIMNHVQPVLVLPEDTLITQGMTNNALWLIASGKCEIQVTNNMRKKVLSNDVLNPGDYFGDISLIYNCLTTATVSSVTYSICAKVTKDVIE